MVFLSPGFQRERCPCWSRAVWGAFFFAPFIRTGSSGRAGVGPAGSGLSSAPWSNGGRFSCNTSGTRNYGSRGTCDGAVDCQTMAGMALTPPIYLRGAAGRWSLAAGTQPLFKVCWYLKLNAPMLYRSSHTAVLNGNIIKAFNIVGVWGPRSQPPSGRSRNCSSSSSTSTDLHVK